MGTKRIEKDAKAKKTDLDKVKKKKKEKKFTKDTSGKVTKLLLNTVENHSKKKIKLNTAVDTNSVVQQEQNITPKKRKKHKKTNKKAALLLATGERISSSIDVPAIGEKQKKRKKPKAIESKIEPATVAQPVKQIKISKKEDGNEVAKKLPNVKPDGPAVPGEHKSRRPRHRGRKKNRTEADIVKRIVIVENLPVKILHTFKDHFEQRFSKYGSIHHIGACEFDEQTAHKEFKTSIVFYDEEAATKALEEDNLPCEGNRLIVRKANEAKDTTLVVRKVSEFNERVIRTIFGSCGPIRRISHVRRPGMDFCTVFVEFWRPESLKEGLNIAKDVKIGGRKLLIGLYDKDNKPPPKMPMQNQPRIAK